MSESTLDNQAYIQAWKDYCSFHTGVNPVLPQASEWLHGETNMIKDSGPTSWNSVF